MAIYTRLKALIQDIRSQEERVRRRWLIVMSAGSMLIVVGLWIQYIQGTVALGEKPPETRPALSAVFSTGLTVLKEKSVDIGSYIKGIIGGERHIIIENPHQNFVNTAIPPIPETPLPPEN